MLGVQLLPALLHGVLVSDSLLVVVLQETLLLETEDLVLLLLVGDVLLELELEPDVVNLVSAEGWR